ncbi:MAG TPA: hypothetical protein VI139_09830 [Gemmatimonadales bacterium]
MKAKRLVPVALVCAAIFAALSCGDRAPTQPHPDSLLLGAVSPSLSLLTCTPLPYDSVTQTVGPAGGTIQVGAYSLVIPDSALDSTVTITAVAPSDTVNAVRFQPQGLHFNQKASLTMSYANCNVLGALLAKQIAYTTDSLQIIDFLPSVDDTASQTVTGSVRHFSEYALAW